MNGFNIRKWAPMLACWGLACLATYWLGRQAASNDPKPGSQIAEQQGLERKSPYPRPHITPIRTTVGPQTVLTGFSATDCLARLSGVNPTNSAQRSAGLRTVIQQLENLVDAGPEAVPVICDFLRQGVDKQYGGRGGEGLAPGSLRSGLFDVLRRIGGVGAEETLVEALTTTKSGAELRQLARLLEEMAPGKFREVSVAVARELMAEATSLTGDAARRQREAAYEVLGRAGDQSQVAAAQAELITGSGKLDETALRYLQRALGEQSFALIQQALADPRLKDGDSKEELVEAIADRAEQSQEARRALQQIAADPNLGRRERDEAFEALRRAGDTSLANVARDRLVTEDGRINESALRYLERAAGDGVLSDVAQAWADPRVQNNKEREELVQIIAGRVGASDAATQMWQQIAGNSQMPANLRSEAIGELDDRGLNRRRPSDQDRQLATARMQLLEQLAPQLNDPQLIHRAQRVYEDLWKIAQAPVPSDRPPRR